MSRIRLPERQVEDYNPFRKWFVGPKSESNLKRNLHKVPELFLAGGLCAFAMVGFIAIYWTRKDLPMDSPYRPVYTVVRDEDISKDDPRRPYFN